MTTIENSAPALAVRIAAVLESLAGAYGGKSQYTDKDVGRALAGWVLNQGWSDAPSTLAEVAAREVRELWDGNCDVDEAAILCGILERMPKNSVCQTLYGSDLGYEGRATAWFVVRGDDPAFVPELLRPIRLCTAHDDACFADGTRYGFGGTE